MAVTIEQDSATVLLLTNRESAALLIACLARVDNVQRTQSEAVHLGRIIRSFPTFEIDRAIEALADTKRER